MTSKDEKAQELLNEVKAQLLPIFVRYNALTGEQGNVPLHIMRQIAAQDGDLNVVQCRDNVGLLGEVIATVCRLIVAEERLDRAHHHLDGDAA